jgi:hypothetical protein
VEYLGDGNGTDHLVIGILSEVHGVFLHPIEGSGDGASAV